jgi:hypothetical protein
MPDVAHDQGPDAPQDGFDSADDLTVERDAGPTD